MNRGAQDDEGESAMQRGHVNSSTEVAKEQGTRRNNTRAKELATKLEKLTEIMEARDMVAKIAEAESTARMDRFESTLESVTKAVDSLASTLERLKLPLVEKPPEGPPPFQSLQARSVKLDFPRFDGSDPLYWIFRAENFFAYYKLTDEERLTIAAVNMEGMVVPWFQLMQKNHQVDSWQALSKAVELEFGPSQFDSPRAKLFKLCQTTTAAEYYREFMILANRVEGLTDDALLDCFISGLKPDLRRDIIAQAPTSLLRAVALARLFDERTALGMPSASKSRPYSSQVTAATPLTTVHSAPSSSKWPPKSALPPLLPTPKSTPLHPVKRLTPAEMQLKREKGECYTCDAKFSWAHKCPNRHYYILLVEEEEVVEEAPTDPVLEEPPGTTTSVPHHLSLNALNSDIAVGTIRFSGSIQGIPVQVLLDGGSSDNFIQPRVVKCLKLPVEPTTAFKVLVGNGNFLTGDGKVQRVELLIQSHKLVITAHVLPITGADIVLGARWLATLGPHVADYSTATIKFFLDGLFVTLKGDRQPQATVAEFHHLRRLHSTHAISEIYTLQPQSIDSVSENGSLPESLPPDLRTLLLHFSSVFAVPKGLPPPRSHDHHIVLQENTPPVKVKPYRYPFVKKDAIESIIAEMLTDGIIQPSTSSFSAPVLDLLHQHTLYAKLSKCSFGQTRVEYLGHFVSAHGVEMDPSKVSAIMDWPSPSNVKQLRGFLGLTGYYRRFIHRYAQIAAPLTNLLKKDSFTWSDEAFTAFTALKQAVTTAPVLVLPNFSKPFIIDTDASGIGVGAVLSQDNRPIAFFSKKISQRQQNRSAYAREMLAITEAVAKFRHYLFGHYFIIRTDQKSLHHLTEQTIQTPEQEEWLPKLLGYQFSIEYKPGRTNTVADALSRSFYMAYSSPVFSILGDIKQSVENDKELFNIFQRCQSNDSPDPRYSVKEGVLCWNNRVVIPYAAADLKKRILWEFHSSPIGGHAGISRTYARVAALFFWKTYHPQSDGQSEAVNKCLEMYLRCFVSGAPRTWFSCLAWAEYWYNTASHSTTGMTPFKVVYGRDPPGLLRYTPSSEDPQDVKERLLLRDEVLSQLKEHLLRAQSRMKHFADQKRTEKQFSVGDFVFVRLQPYRQHSVQLRRNQKLGLRYFGPFEVVARVGQVAYKLNLPPEARIHNVFHVSQLKPCVRPSSSATLPLPLLTAAEGPLIRPSKILEMRQVQVGHEWETQILVLWEDDADPTWEPLAVFRDRYPNFDLEDKVNANGGGDVMNRGAQDDEGESAMQRGHVNSSTEVAKEQGTRRSTRMKRPTWKVAQGKA
ncbi:Transposon Ty3-I Gag-Pol polyprotein [Senna tora]|uniref:Transposon Ty3-I Gag-Pol polyprotein n=1 Tax=Senna tora TaxID=362788 RepID=A0A834SQW9_9FABA|nr:Transposon Ty3-I Gag-Pol polyprotein [Senna tora]